jgi:hypothetical protein
MLDTAVEIGWMAESVESVAEGRKIIIMVAWCGDV